MERQPAPDVESFKKFLIMNSKQLIKKLKQDGWIQTAQKGSHKKFKHPQKPGIVIVPDHGNVDIPVGTLNNILKQAGWK